MPEPTDVLSDPARRILDLNAEAACTRLVVRGDGTAEARSLLEKLQPPDLLTVPVKDTEHAQALLAGLWLWHDWLDESHQISQQIHSSTGSFWHAIMHRREGDFSNSKYWYARCKGHSILPVIGSQAGPVINRMAADKSLLRLVADGWDPGALVDLVEQVHERPDDPLHKVAVSLQQLEWRMLFDHGVRQAAGQ
jgi:hypothetical protein